MRSLVLYSSMYEKGYMILAVARYLMICLVLVNSHLFLLPCGTGSTVPCEGFNLSAIILASLLVLPMLGCRHSLMRHCNISRFSQVECTFQNIPTCVQLPVGGHYIVLLALTFRNRVLLLGHLLIVDHFNNKIKYLSLP